VLKALGDNTRYAVYLEVARAASPLSTAEVAETLGLHPNTVRPHLERMREVGLLEVEVDGRGSVGRPQHRYLLAPDSPSLGLEPPAFPMLAGMLAALAAAGRFGPDDTAAAGTAQGRALASRALGADDDAERAPAACTRALVAAMAELGFDPAVVDGDGSVSMAFTRCPYRELAEAYPELVCHLHRGLVEGFVDGVSEAGGAEMLVERFATLTDRDPCQVSLSVG